MVYEDYLAYIDQQEPTNEKFTDEKVDRILYKYFNNYTFNNKKEVGAFLRLFIDKFKTKLFIRIHNLTSHICKHEYSYNENDGWHEGYNAFIGDINHCYGDTLKEAQQSLYVKDIKRNWDNDLYARIGLITEGTGYGKTNWIENEFIDEINNQFLVYNQMEKVNLFKRKDILFITTRSSILEQQKANGLVVDACEEDFSINGANEIYDNRQDKVRIILVQNLGSWYLNGKIEKMFPIVVIDEIHSMFLDTTFADTTYAGIDCLNHFWYQCIKVGLTATPKIIENCLDKTKFYLLSDVCLPAKHNTKELHYCSNTYLDSVIKMTNPTKEHKVLVYCFSARHSIELARKYGGKFLISKNNEDRFPKEILEQEPLRQFVINNQKLPDDVNIVFMTSAYREGVEFKDDKIKTLIIDACDDTTISQFIGRVRNSVDKVIVVMNVRQRERIEEMADKYVRFSKFSQAELAEQYEIQIENMEKKDNETYMIIREGDVYYLNPYIKPIIEYQLDCYYQATNRPYSKVITNGNRELLDSDDWFYSFLRGYNLTPIGHIDGKEELNKVMANWGVVNEYIGERLYAEQKEELVNKIGWFDDTHWRLFGWRKVKQELQRLGYVIKSGQDCQKKRYDILV